MALINLSNSEIKNKIIEICDYANNSSRSWLVQKQKNSILRLFNDIKNIVEGIISERSVLDNLTDLITKQEHTIVNQVMVKPGKLTEFIVGPVEAAEKIGRSRETVYRLCKQGDLDSTMIKGRIKITQKSIDKYIAERS